MVRAILAGQKTQTPRAVKPDGAMDVVCFIGADNQPTGEFGWCPHPSLITRHIRCPFGQPGDRLRVRETTVNVEKHGYLDPVYLESEEGRESLNFGLAPAPDDMTEVEPHELILRPSIHMPRSMCRLVLEVTAVRVERLQQITADDCLAEGISTRFEVADAAEDLLIQWRDLWTSTGGEWVSNPWVWVIEFKRVEVAGG